jgi:hypothetical protein
MHCLNGNHSKEGGNVMPILQGGKQVHTAAKDTREDSNPGFTGF